MCLFSSTQSPRSQTVCGSTMFRWVVMVWPALSWCHIHLHLDFPFLYLKMVREHTLINIPMSSNKQQRKVTKYNFLLSNMKQPFFVCFFGYFVLKNDLRICCMFKIYKWSFSSLDFLACAAVGLLAASMQGAKSALDTGRSVFPPGDLHLTCS